MADQLLSTTPHHDTLPENYVRPESERPRLSEVVTDSNIPVINLSSSDKNLIISQIANACENYGVFQVVNHGITEEMLRKVMGIGMEFFRLSPEEKAKLYSDDPAKKMRLSTSFNVKKEKVHNWRDYLRLHCYPLEDFVPDWPAKPELFKCLWSKTNKLILRPNAYELTGGLIWSMLTSKFVGLIVMWIQPQDHEKGPCGLSILTVINKLCLLLLFA